MACFTEKLALDAKTATVHVIFNHMQSNAENHCNIQANAPESSQSVCKPNKYNGARGLTFHKVCHSSSNAEAEFHNAKPTGTTTESIDTFLWPIQRAERPDTVAGAAAALVCP